MLHRTCVQYYTRLSEVGNGQKSRRRKGQSALQVDTYVDSSKIKETIPSIIHFSVCMEVSHTSYLLLFFVFSKSVAAFCVCVTHSPTLS